MTINSLCQYWRSHFLAPRCSQWHNKIYSCQIRRIYWLFECITNYFLWSNLSYETGPGWGKYFVGPLQLGVCYGAVIACTLLGGQSLKVNSISSTVVIAMYQLSLVTYSEFLGIYITLNHCFSSCCTHFSIYIWFPVQMEACSSRNLFSCLED